MAPAPRASPAAAPARARHELGFWVVAFGFLAVTAFSTVPSPLYGLLEARDGFGSFTVTLVYAAYAVGVLVSLLFVGHLSDVRGRRALLLPALVVAILSAAIFLIWRHLPGLFAGRIVNGLAIGIVTPTATAFLTELYEVAHPGTDARRAQVVAIAANLGGLGLGALVSGALAQWVGSPLTVPFVVLLAALGVAFVVVATGAPETRPAADPLPPYRRQQVSVPQAARGPFVAASAGSFFAFGATGLFAALAPTFLVGTLHHGSHLLAGVTLFLLFAASAASQSLTARMALEPLLRTAVVLLVVGLGLTTLSAWLASPSLALFLVGGAVVGAGCGMMVKGSIATVIAIAPPAVRGEVVAGYFVASYAGISIPVVGAGIALQLVSPRLTLLLFAAAVTVALIAVSPALLRGQRA